MTVCGAREEGDAASPNVTDVATQMSNLLGTLTSQLHSTADAAGGQLKLSIVSLRQLQSALRSVSH